MEIQIGNKIISNTGKPYFIADIAANHDGSLERAFKLIELAKEAGADAAKFQNFHASSIVSRSGFDSMEKMTHQASWKKSVYDVYDDATLPLEWTEKLKKKCDEVDIEYMTSPYDKKSVDQVEAYVNAYKIGSGDIQWTDMLSYIAQKKKPVILATGASSIQDVQRAYQTIQQYENRIVLMQCNTNYTAKVENYERHPDSDHLGLLCVNDGKQKLQVVCGAPNCHQGMVGVFAPVGTVIPMYNEKLTVGKIRGVESFGMMCSEKELGIGEDHNLSLIHISEPTRH